MWHNGKKVTWSVLCIITNVLYIIIKTGNENYARHIGLRILLQRQKCDKKYLHDTYNI